MAAIKQGFLDNIKAINFTTGYAVLYVAFNGGTDDAADELIKISGAWNMTLDNGGLGPPASGVASDLSSTTGLIPLGEFRGSALPSGGAHIALAHKMGKGDLNFVLTMQTQGIPVGQYDLLLFSCRSLLTTSISINTEGVETDTKSKGDALIVPDMLHLPSLVIGYTSLERDLGTMITHQGTVTAGTLDCTII